MLIVDAGNSRLALAIAAKLSLKCIKPGFKEFACGEYAVSIEQNLTGESLLVIGAADRQVDENYMKLLLLLDALKNKGAVSIILFLPYISYSRQDRATLDNDATSARVIANLLNSSPINQLVTLDIHSKQTASYFTKNLYNISAFDLFGELVRGLGDCVIIAPDKGAGARAQIFAAELGLDIALIDKQRIGNKVSSVLIKGEVLGKKCVIIDDIIDSGNTVKEAALLLRNNGVISLSAFITHGLFSENIPEDLQSLGLDELWITDSIVHNLLPNGVKKLDATAVIAHKIMPACSADIENFVVLSKIS